ncbi:forespore capture DNA-binding protein RefZ [Virgibacillus sp. W0430]|uniref:forespore capture DNA-binding protein RefZ n=1 Tax=Virgibacillus sp. W0430 TaxID=3391580 RepID=UPI003F48DB88
MKVNSTKQKVIDAATLLFFQNGFNGTSVRDIAEKAAVNVSLISYYFKSKQGLLEYAVTHYYENYLREIEATMNQTASLSPLNTLKKLIDTIIQYKQSNHQFTCFVQRELMLDTIFVREMTVTYLAKEHYYIYKAFKSVLQLSGERDDEQFLLMQLKGMLITPYVLQHDWKNKVIGIYSHEQFANKYVNTIYRWLDYITGTNK